MSLKSNIEMLVGVASLPHSRPPEYRHFTVETGKTVNTFAKQCISQPFQVISSALSVVVQQLLNRASFFDLLAEPQMMATLQSVYLAMLLTFTHC